jgi:phosphomevalonate kinase
MDQVHQRIVLVFSGKRKSGKDYTTDLIVEHMPNSCEIRRLSAPLKKAYAEEHGLDYERLLSADSYKEQFREDMIVWGVAKRTADPGYFARLTCADATKPVLIISDARRSTDVDFFLTHPQWGSITKTVRIVSSEEARAQRGWKFTPGVDDVDSETGLDEYGNWDFIIRNDGDVDVFNQDLSALLAQIDAVAQESSA